MQEGKDVNLIFNILLFLLFSLSLYPFSFSASPPHLLSLPLFSLINNLYLLSISNITGDNRCSSFFISSKHHLDFALTCHFFNEIKSVIKFKSVIKYQNVQFMIICNSLCNASQVLLVSSQILM